MILHKAEEVELSVNIKDMLQVLVGFSTKILDFYCDHDLNGFNSVAVMYHMAPNCHT